MKHRAHNSLAGITVYGAADGPAGGDDAKPRGGELTWPCPNDEILTGKRPVMRAYRVKLPARS
jgi:hypothetical protein